LAGVTANNTVYIPVQNGVLALDNVPGSSGYTFSPSWFSANGTSQLFTDGPSARFEVPVKNPDGTISRIRVTTISRNSRYNLYIAFQPSGSDTIPVYLRRADWGCAGTAQYFLPFLPPIATGTEYANSSVPVIGEVEWAYDASPLDFQFMKE
jgi:hypothetical protein